MFKHCVPIHIHIRECGNGNLQRIYFFLFFAYNTSVCVCMNKHEQSISADEKKTKSHRRGKPRTTRERISFQFSRF